MNRNRYYIVTMVAYTIVLLVYAFVPTRTVDAEIIETIEKESSSARSEEEVVPEIHFETNKIEMVGNEQVVIVEESAPTVTVEETVEETTIQEEEVGCVEEDQPIQEEVYESYNTITINNERMNFQYFVYEKCVEFGIEDFFPQIMCQIYQESRFDQSAVGNGLDYGLFQLRITYHDYFKSLCGHPEFDVINDPYANIYVGCFLMSEYYKETGDWDSALKRYYCSGNEYLDEKYVQDVMQWMKEIEYGNGQ